MKSKHRCLANKRLASPDLIPLMLNALLLGCVVTAIVATAIMATATWAEENAASAAPVAPVAPPAATPADTPKTAEKTEEKSADTADTNEPKSAAAATSHQGWIHGSFQAGVDGAWSKHESDVELSQSLQVRVDPPGYEKLHLRGSLLLDEDLSSSDPHTSGLRNINDAYDDVRARLLYLYADFDDLWGDSVLRIGRQRIEDGVAFNRFDGLSFRQRVGNQWEWYAFGGIRASLYVDTHNDPVFGGGVTFRPNSSTRFSVDSYFGEENRSDNDVVHRWPFYNWFGEPFPREIKKDRSDNQVAFSVWHQITPNINVSGRFELFDGKADKIQLGVTGYVAAADLTYELRYRGQLRNVDDRDLDLDQFYRIVGELSEYNDFLVAVHRPLCKDLVLSLEAEIRNSDADERWDMPNRDFTRFAAMLDAAKLPGGLQGSVGLEYYNASGDEGTFAIVGELSKQWEKFRLTLGADFNRYEDRVSEYNPTALWVDVIGRRLLGFWPGSPSAWVYFADGVEVTTHENVYALYAKAKWTVCKDQDVTFGVTYEDDDEPDAPYWRVQAAYSIAF